MSHKENYPGNDRERATPVPIPNTEVKPLFADGTAWVAVWESRTLPGLNKIKKRHLSVFFLFPIF